MEASTVMFMGGFVMMIVAVIIYVNTERNSYKQVIAKCDQVMANLAVTNKKVEEYKSLADQVKGDLIENKALCSDIKEKQINQGKRLVKIRDRMIPQRVEIDFIETNKTQKKAKIPTAAPVQ